MHWNVIGVNFTNSVFTIYDFEVGDAIEINKFGLYIIKNVVGDTIYVEPLKVVKFLAN